MTFTLFDASSGGNQVGDIVSKPSVSVVGGSFGVDLSYPGIFAGQQLWLQIAVNGQILTNREIITAAPVAQFALNGARALDYVNNNPSSATTPPATDLNTVGPFTFSASCGIDPSTLTVKASLFVDSASAFDAGILNQSVVNDTGAPVADLAHGTNITGTVGLTVYPAATGNYRRAMSGPVILRERAAGGATVSVTYYMIVDGRPASTACAVYGTATLFSR
jgi:hypothetical protein